MTLTLEILDVLERIRPGGAVVALLAARIAPVAFLSPALGSRLLPTPIRLSLCLLLALHAHCLGGIAAAPAVLESAWGLLRAFACEISCGIAIGLGASLPFDAARIGGRLADNCRGASAEAVEPFSGSRESATGDLLHQLLLALVVVGPAHRLLLNVLLGSLRTLPPGAPSGLQGWPAIELALVAAVSSLAAGLSIGAPAAAVSLLVDLGVGLAARAVPSIPARDFSAPVKLLVGTAALLVALGACAQRLCTATESMAVALGALSGSPGRMQ